jgi:hypothetical protein
MNARNYWTLSTEDRNTIKRDVQTVLPMRKEDFEGIYHENGTCGARYDCGQAGVVLAYDIFSPEVATWFCAECWKWANEDMPADFLTIVEDKREGDNE